MIDFIEYKRRIELSLWQKIQWAIERYIDFVEVYGLDNVYTAFSGGKDSQVMIDIIEKLHAGEMMEFLSAEYIFLYYKLIHGHPFPQRVFADTKIEYPELRKHAEKFDDVFIVLPTKFFKQVVNEDGFAVVSKIVSRQISDLQNPTDRNENTRRLYEHGINSKGEYKKNMQIPNKWLFLKDAPFKISGKCCDYFKKEPFAIYEAQTGKVPIIGTTSSESALRRLSYMKNGCNTFGTDAPKSRPMSIFTEQDMWDYSEKYGIVFCEVYYDRCIVATKTFVKGERRTGCVVCGLGINQEKGQNRYQRMAITHPKMHKYFIYSVLKEKLDYLNVPYEPTQLPLI